MYCVWKASWALSRVIPWPWVCGYLHQLSKRALTSTHPSTSWPMWETSSVSWSCLKRRQWWWWSLTVSIKSSRWSHLFSSHLEFYFVLSICSTFCLNIRPVRSVCRVYNPVCFFGLSFRESGVETCCARRQRNVRRVWDHPVQHPLGVSQVWLRCVSGLLSAPQEQAKGGWVITVTFREL